MNTVRWMVCAAALALVATGCGSSVADDDEAASGSGGSGSGSGGAGSGATGGGTSTGGTGGTNECAAFADETGTAEVTVRFRNDSPLPVYLPGNCAFVQYGIRPSSGDDGTLYAADLTCLQTCEQLQTSPPIVCGACAPSSWLIPPGGTHEVAWNGTGLRQEAMPAACYYEGQPFDDTCAHQIAAAPNTYRVEVSGYGACEGFETGAECQCESTGQCFGTASGASAFADVVEFAYPSTTLVEVVFGPCAFGCPNEDDG